MPPRPPNFLPPNRRRRLDPSRRLRSRELWNRVRYLSSSSSNKNNNNIVEYTKALLRAIAYECQPFPILPTLHHVVSFVRGSIGSDDNNDDDGSTETIGLARFPSTIIYVHITSMILATTRSTRKFNVTSIASFMIANKVALCKTCIVLIALLLYRRALVYLHDLLAIGPLVVIITLLTVLYTVGLGDDTGANSGVPSAYSVFNKGMARLLGTIDGEELARQYAGGGGAGAGAAADARGDGFARLNNNNDPLDDEEDEVWEEWMDEEEIVNERRRQRRLERLRRREHDDDDNDNNNNNNNNNNANEDKDYELDDTRQESAAAAAAAAVATRKKSGKKARRKDLELRREMQQQRRVAAAMGFGVGDELAVEDIREIEARFALLE